MPLIEGKCKNCGAQIEFDDSLKSGICPFCNTPYLKEDMIIHNHYENSTVIINDENSIENKLENAEVFLTKIGDYNEAQNIYEYVIKNKTSDYRGWWGMVRVLSKNFSLIEMNEQQLSNIVNYADNALKLVPKENLDSIKEQWETYSSKVLSYINAVNENIAKQERKATIRKRIFNIIGLIPCVGAITFLLLSPDIHSLMFEIIDPTLKVLAFVGINMVFQCIVGLLGRTYIPTFLSTLTSVFCCGYIISGLTNGFQEHHIVMIILIVIAFVIVAICFMIPNMVLIGVVPFDEGSDGNTSDEVYDGNTSIYK